MKKFFLFGVAMFFVGCSTVIKVGDQIERAATPPDAVNYVTTKPDGSYEAQLNDGRLADSKIKVATYKYSVS